MMIKKSLKYVISFILLILLGFLYGFANVRNEQKVISKINIEFEPGVNNFLSQPMVNKLLIQNNKSVLNQPKSVIDLHELEKKVLSNPYVENATLFYTVNGVLNSTIKQRKPIARIISSNGNYYIDSQGVRVPISSQYSARVPLITGVNSKSDLQEVYGLLQFIVLDDFLKKEIIGIDINEEKDYTLSVRSGNYKIEFGKLSDIEVKFQKLKAFYAKAFVDKSIQKYEIINIKYHNQVVGVK